MNRKIIIFLSAAVVFQFFVLTGMYTSAGLPLWTGNEVKIKTIPVDPRSMFRGNYARLGYDISQIESQYFPDNVNLRNGEVVYVSLKQGANELYEFSSVSLDKPENGVYLRGRIEDRYFMEEATHYRIKYGIEAFFAPEKKALELESELRDGGVAQLMVSTSGKARLKDVIAE